MTTNKMMNTAYESTNSIGLGEKLGGFLQAVWCNTRYRLKRQGKNSIPIEHL